MRYFLGLDAGGTKTYCLVGDEEGNIRGFGRAGAGNYETYGLEPAKAENREAVENALRDAGIGLANLAGIGMGIAGADLLEDYDMLEREIFTPLFGDVPRAFRNDSMAGLRGGTREPFGIVIACGTGCVCAGRNRAGEEDRVGGLGEEFGDECTGTSLGRQGLRRVWQARDGVFPATCMTQKFVERSGCSDADELFHRLYRGEMSERRLEPMAAIVFDAAREGDAAAIEILERGGRYLGAMVNAVARKLNMTGQEFEVVMAGSVFKGSSPVLINAMSAAIHDVCAKVRSVMPVFEPVVGALLMGMELELKVNARIYDNLTEQLRAAERQYGVRFVAE